MIAINTTCTRFHALQFGPSTARPAFELWNREGLHPHPVLHKPDSTRNSDSDSVLRLLFPFPSLPGLLPNFPITDLLMDDDGVFCMMGRWQKRKRCDPDPNLAYTPTLDMPDQTRPPPEGSTQSYGTSEEGGEKKKNCARNAFV